VTCIRTSAPIERSFQRVTQWQHPSRREFIHGPIRPMNDNLVTMGKRRVWFWIQFAVYAVCTLYALKLWIIR
jgi:hypothetical protein